MTKEKEIDVTNIHPYKRLQILYNRAPIPLPSNFIPYSASTAFSQGEDVSVFKIKNHCRKSKEEGTGYFAGRPIKVTYSKKEEQESFAPSLYYREQHRYLLDLNPSDWYQFKWASDYNSSSQEKTLFFSLDEEKPSGIYYQVKPRFSALSQYRVDFSELNNFSPCSPLTLAQLTAYKEQIIAIAKLRDSLFLEDKDYELAWYSEGEKPGQNLIYISHDNINDRHFYYTIVEPLYRIDKHFIHLDFDLHYPITIEQLEANKNTILEHAKAHIIPLKINQLAFYQSRFSIYLHFAGNYYYVDASTMRMGVYDLEPLKLSEAEKQLLATQLAQAPRFNYSFGHRDNSEYGIAALPLYGESLEQVEQSTSSGWYFVDLRRKVKLIAQIDHLEENILYIRQDEGNNKLIYKIKYSSEDFFEDEIDIRDLGSDLKTPLNEEQLSIFKDKLFSITDKRAHTKLIDASNLAPSNSRLSFILRKEDGYYAFKRRGKYPEIKLDLTKSQLNWIDGSVQYERYNCSNWKKGTGVESILAQYINSKSFSDLANVCGYSHAFLELEPIFNYYRLEYQLNQKIITDSPLKSLLADNPRLEEDYKQVSEQFFWPIQEDNLSALSIYLFHEFVFFNEQSNIEKLFATLSDQQVLALLTLQLEYKLDCFLESRRAPYGQARQIAKQEKHSELVKFLEAREQNILLKQFQQLTACNFENSRAFFSQEQLILLLDFGKDEDKNRFIIKNWLVKNQICQVCAQKRLDTDSFVLNVTKIDLKKLFATQAMQLNKNFLPRTQGFFNQGSIASLEISPIDIPKCS